MVESTVVKGVVAIILIKSQGGHMNGKQAKKLRKKIYKEENFRERSEYVTSDNPTTIIGDSFRRRYQQAKKKGK